MNLRNIVQPNDPLREAVVPLPLHAGSPREIRQRKILLVTMFIVALVAFDFLSSLVIVKAEFLDGFLLQIPVGFLGLSVLLAVHVGITNLLLTLNDTKVERAV